MPRYQLSIHAEKLPRGLFRKPNSYAQVTVSGGPREGETIGRTEAVENTLDPQFTRVLFIETDPSVFLPLKVTIINDRNGAELANGVFEATEVAEAPGHLQCQKAQNGCRLYASIEESLKGDKRGDCTMHFRGLDIKNVEPGVMGLGRSDPYFELSRKNADHAAGVVRWNAIYRSKHITDHLNPFWDDFNLTLEEICYGDLDWPLKITVFDYENNGKHREIGQFETTMAMMMKRVSVRGNADRERAFEIFTEGKNKSRGLIVVLKADVRLA